MYVCRQPLIDQSPWSNVVLGIAIGLVVWGCIASVVIAYARAHR